MANLGFLGLLLHKLFLLLSLVGFGDGLRQKLLRHHGSPLLRYRVLRF